jgi:hypothetical protein
MSLRRRALFLAGLLAAVSCSDAGDPLGVDAPRPPAAEPGNSLQALDCTVDVRQGSVRCESAQPGTGAASGIIVGGQNQFVRLASSGVAVEADTFKFNATVTNLTPQALGVDANGASDAEGVRVFFHSGPTADGGGGPIVVEGAAGSAVFITGNKPYYQYAGGLDPQETSESIRWKFLLNGATKFTFKVYVSANVRYPQGWVDISPNSALLQVGETAVLADTVRNQVGTGISDDVNWSSSNPGVVSVTETSDSTAVIEGVSQGTAWIKAQSVARPVRMDSILVTVNNAPVLNLDSISAVSNVTMPVDSANGMLANDDSDEKLTVSAGTISSDRGGTATLAANGSFTYLSKPGYAGLDTIRYTVTDGTRTLPGKAVVRVENSAYWFVRAGASGDGRDASPFGTLAAAQDSAVAGDTIVVFANGVQQVDGAVTLEAGQAIIGAGTSEAIARGTYNGAAITVLAAGGSAPSLTNTGPGATITLGTNNVIRGVGITAAGGAAIAGTSFGTLFVRDAGVNPAGPALQLSTGALDAVFDVLSSTGSTTTGLSLTGVTGSLTGTGGAIAGSVGTAFQVSGGSASITYGGSISNGSGLAASISGRTGGDLAVSGSVTDAAGGISVTGNSGGTVSFSGALSLTGSGIAAGSNTGGTIAFTHASKSVSTGTNAAVSLTNNTGATVLFGGGGLAVSTTSGAGFTATGGGTVSVTGPNNTVSSTTGTAVTLTGVSTGVDGASFRSVSADGAPSGIVLSGVTGAGVQVSGSGATAGSGGSIQNTTGHAVSLSSMAGADSVSLKNMTVSGGNAGSAGIFGSAFGTLRVAGLSVGTTGGPALSLATGTLNGGFSSLGSASSASNGVILTSTNGSFTAGAGTITGAASTAFAVAGGSVSATFAGSIAQANAAPLVAVSGSHTGALTFETGTLSASNGTGLQFNDADGTYAFNGTTTLNGGDAAIDITNSSTGSFTFGTGASVTNPTGSAFNVYGSSPTVTYSGSLTKGNAGLLVEIGEQPGGTVTFNTGTLSATAGTGITLSNADGVVNFNGTTTLNGGDAGVDVVSGSSGAISFGTGASIANASGIALRVFNGGASTNVTYAGSVTSSATGLAVHVEGVSGGSVTASGAVSGTNGIVVQNNTGGTITFSGAKSLNTGVNNAVTLSTNTGATVDFTNGNNDITTTTGTAFTATGGGTVSVSGAGSDINTGTGNALALNGVTLGASGMTFATLNTGAATAPVSLTNVGVTSGSAITVAGGTISAGAGTRFAVNGGAVNATWAGTINQSQNNSLLGVSNGHTGELTFSNVLSATNGNGLQFDNADGSYTFGTVTLNGGDAGIDVTNGSAGTFSFPAAANIVSPSTGNLVSILNSSPNFTYAGAFTKANNNVTGILVQNNASGSISFTGSGVTKSISSGTAAAVNLSSNGTATITFSGGSLALAAGSGAGLTATGGGTVSVTGANNTVNTNAGGTAVNIQNTTIGASGVSFYSINATGGGTHGIFLSATGSGGFQVTGDGASDAANTTRGRTTAKSGGGTVALGSGGTISGKSGDAISLSTTGPVILRNMVIQNNSGDGVQATTSTGVTIDNTRITGHTDNSALFFTGVSAPVITHSEMENNAFGSGAPGADIHNVRLISNTGTASVTNSVIANTSAGAERQLQIFSTTGTLNIGVTNNRIGGSTIGDGVGVFARGSSNVTATFENDSIHNNSAFGIDSGTETTQSATLNITVNNTAFRDNFLGITVAHGSSGTNTFSITNNRIRTSVASSSHGINVNRLSGDAFTSFGLFSGTVANNVIGVDGVANSGSAAGDGVTVKTNGNGGTTRVSILNNTIRNYGQHGISLTPRDASSGHTLHARIQGNNIAEGKPVTSQDGINVTMGALNTDVIALCLDIGGAGAGNTVSSAVRNGIRVRSSGLPAANVSLTAPAYDGTGPTYFANRNPAATGATANTSFSNASGTTNPGNCTTP